MLDTALAYHRRGDLTRAEELYRQILEREPNHQDALHLLGVAAHQSGRQEEAVRLIRAAISIDARQASFHNNLGEALRASDNARGAESCYREAIRLDRSYAEAHNNLGLALAAQGEAHDAIAFFHRAIEIAPAFAEAYVNQGNALAELGHLEDAAVAYEKAVLAQPDFVDAHVSLGCIRHELGQAPEAQASFEAALLLRPGDAALYSKLADVFTEQDNLKAAGDACRTALGLAPDNTDIRIQLGRILRDDGKIEEAIAQVRMALATEPDLPHAHHLLSRLLLLQDQSGEALEHARRALELEPDLGLAHNYVGELLLVRGRIEEALPRFQRALELDSDCVPAYENLAHARKFSRRDGHLIERIEALIARGDIPERALASLHFSLGKILGDCELYDRAFAAFAEGNRLMRGAVSYDGRVHREWIDDIVSSLGREAIESKRALGDATEVPVFIIGMPRSGTTLVEQILSRHPGVHGAGEVGQFAAILKSGRGGEQLRLTYPQYVGGLDKSTASELQQAYLDRLRRDAPEAIRVSDKMPANFVYLGLIAILFPRARLIHCRREPLDVCLSIYFQNFAFPGGHPYAWDLFELGQYYRQYERLMDHWQDALPGRIHEVRYEDLVNDLEAVSRDLLVACGLDWDDRCLAFYDNPRPVQTASAWQVRQPVYTTSVARHRHYEAHLDDLKRGLASPG